MQKIGTISGPGNESYQPGKTKKAQASRVIPLAEIIKEKKRKHRNEAVLPEENDIAELRKMIPHIMKEIDAGKPVKQIARKHGIPEELAEQITRMYLTHPGIDVEGILNRIMRSQGR